MFGINSNIELITFPITYVSGGYNNIFHGFADNEIILQLQDFTAESIENNSGTIKVYNLSAGIPSYINNGDLITIVGGKYDKKTGIVSNKASTHIDLDIDFIGSDLNRLAYQNRLGDDYKIEYRFINSATQDIQSGAPIISDNTYYAYNDLNGYYKINLQMLSGLFNSTLTASEVNSKLSLEFQVQIREVESGSPLGDWETILDSSQSSFNKFIMIHSTNRTAAIIAKDNRFVDIDLETRIWRNYTKTLTYLASDANKTLFPAVIKKEYSQTKTLLSQTSTLLPNVGNGLNAFDITSIVNDSCRFVRLFENKNSSEINLTVYETTQDETEFYLTWLSDKGSVRNWLFNSISTFNKDYDSELIVESSFRQIPLSVEESITLRTQSITKKEYNYLQSLFGSNKIKVENQGEEIECSVNKPKIEYDNKTNTYNFQIDLILKPTNTQNI